MENDQVTGIDSSIIQKTKTDGNDVKERKHNNVNETENNITKNEYNIQYNLEQKQNNGIDTEEQKKIRKKEYNKQYYLKKIN